MASLTADEEVAFALEASGRRAQSRAAHASAATALLRAAELSTDEGRRDRPHRRGGPGRLGRRAAGPGA